MAMCYPDYGGDRSAFQSAGEGKFYDACKAALAAEYRVFHSVAWIAPSGRGEAKDGEADFVICHPEKGVLVVEVKGGGVRADLRVGKWTSTDQHGVKHEIKDPFKQALRGKFNIIEKLKQHRDWPSLDIRRVSAGHAVFFTDLNDARSLQGPEAPSQIIGDKTDLLTLNKWVSDVFQFWTSQDDIRGPGSGSPLGVNGIELVRRIFARVVEINLPLFTRVEEERAKQIVLTNQQIGTLDLLARQRRVAVSGGAGTGKTVLAREKALRLASEGFRTLLTCYNRPLADYLRATCEPSNNLEVASFHQLCSQWIKRADAQSGRNLLKEAIQSYPRMDLYDHHMPIALSYATEIIADRYDAIIVDEGQDFGEEFWLPLEMLLIDLNESPFYIFFDENQKLYTRVSTFPIKTSPITLTRNCRNTRTIHNLAYAYYSGTEVEAPPITGDVIHTLEAASIEKQAQRIHELVTRLIVKEKFSAGDISVLIAEKLHKRTFEEALMRQKLPAEIHWGDVDSDPSNRVTIETVARFKGLETAVLILWGFDELHQKARKETLYVGVSRARSIVYLCGSRESCEALMAKAV